MTRIPPFDIAQMTAIAKVLGDTSTGLSGSEIDRLLVDSKIPNVDPDATKWKRILNAFISMQNDRQFGNHVVMFVKAAMNPARYTTSPALFSERRDKLNAVLAFAGIQIGEDGQPRRSTPAASLDVALARAGRLHAALISRGVHPDVLGFCKAELLQENYFHAVFEAMKSIAAKIRASSGLVSDGAELVTQAFALGKPPNPILAINALRTESELGEQRGFVNLLVGLFGTIRNPAAHNPKIEWPMPEQDALDILTTASLIHRKLDNARRYRVGAG